MAVAEFPATVPARSTGLDAAIYLGLMVFIGSSTATAAKFAVRELPIAYLPIVRFGVAGLCLLPLAWGGGAFLRMVRQDGGRLLVTAMLCVPINQSFFLSGTRLTSTTHVGLIYAACPLIVLGLACALGQERLTRARLEGVLASVLGIFVIGLNSILKSGAPSPIVGADPMRGDFLVLCAVIAWGAYLTVSKPLVARHGALPALAGTFLVGAAMQVAILALTATGWPAIPAASPRAWWGLAFLTLVVSVLGLSCQNQALRRLDASQVAAVGNLAPLLTVLWGVLFFGEEVNLALAIGGALTLGGVVWAGRPNRRPAALAPSA